MRQNLHELVPNSICEELRLSDLKDFEQLTRHIFVDLLEVLGDKKFDDEDIFLHVPAACLLFLVEAFLRGGDQPLAECLDP